MIALRAEIMIPHRLHANGVPWLIWIADQYWECEGCGESGRQTPFTDVVDFARWAGDLKRAHAGCGVSERRPAKSIGHPLNPDRQEA